MSVNLLEQEKSYRRGVVLGLTMAEVVILVLFALLLALAVKMEKQEHQIASLEDRITETEQRAEAAEKEKSEALEELAPLRKYLSNLNSFDEEFKSLVLAKQENIRLRNEIAGLTEKAKSVEAVRERAARAEDLEKQVQELQAHDQIVRRVQQAMGEPRFPPDTLAGRLAELVTLGMVAERAAGEGKDTSKLIAEAAKAAAEERRRADNFQGQLAQMKKMFADAGRGTEKPACWATKAGKPEYIFDVALRTGGVVVRDNALPQRADEQAALSIHGFQYLNEITVSEFRAAALPLQRWGEEHDCRFFVRVFDQTGATDKAMYKKMLWTVGEYFYYYEPRTGIF
ncbi:hypothetical protein F1643_06030 [Azospirillum sp. INR13]|uniref:hypothetical protein n=1 Tax=Azospirillum sp. INR13 TaxID=2596919 RepID=UPI00189211F2|nr:hypothetical protein [Azospirillum sp. INR13]MBF5094109.1 hypothetical protein [Azospirillum sp. INR13]